MHYWTERARQLWEELNEKIVGLRRDVRSGHEDAVAALRSAGEEALAARDPEALCAVLKLVDVHADTASEIRFTVAVNAMRAGNYGCALAAWEDAGGCWSVCSDAPGIPSSSTAAGALMAACVHILRLQRELDEHTLSSMMRDL